MYSNANDIDVASHGMLCHSMNEPNLKFENGKSKLTSFSSFCIEKHLEKYVQSSWVWWKAKEREGGGVWAREKSSREKGAMLYL